MLNTKKYNRRNKNVFLLIIVTIILVGSFTGMILRENTNSKPNTNNQLEIIINNSSTGNQHKDLVLLSNITTSTLCDPVCDSPW